MKEDHRKSTFAPMNTIVSLEIYEAHTLKLQKIPSCFVKTSQIDSVYLKILCYIASMYTLRIISIICTNMSGTQTLNFLKPFVHAEKYYRTIERSDQVI